MLSKASSKPIADYNKQTDEVCRLFSSTLQSLTADAAAIRQLSNLSNLINNDEENRQPNSQNQVRDAIPFCNDSSSPLAQLQSFDQAVASIEQKVSALRSIVFEEKRAIEYFEGCLRDECEAQRMAVENLLQAHQEIQIYDQISVSAKAESKPEELSERMTTGEISRPKYTTFSSENIETTREITASGNARNKEASRKRRDSVDPRVDQNVQPATFDTDEDENGFSFLRVTDHELSRISRNSRGRIGLIDLNEALEEIESVAERKFDAIPRNVSFSSASQQRRFDYLRQQRGSNYQDIEVEAHQGHYWVSEQELRENCVFFRNGESTARAILSILCSLRRLKQIPGKKRQVTYLCLVHDNNDKSDN